MSEYMDEPLSNLLQETLEKLAKHGKRPEDVRFVLDADGYACEWETFAKYAHRIDYDKGCGCNEIALGIAVVGGDWYLDRREHDGSEWWEFNRLPEIPNAFTGAPRLLEKGSEHRLLA